MSKEVTRDEIDKLPHFTKVAFAARCARLAWNQAALHCWLSAAESLTEARQGLRAVLWRAECWGTNIDACQFAEQSAKKEPDLRNAHERAVCSLDQFVNTLSGSGPLELALCDAVVAAFHVTVPPWGAPENQGNDTDRTKVAYDAALRVRPSAGAAELMAGILREDYDALVRFLSPPDSPTVAPAEAPRSGAMGPEFFNARHSRYYKPPPPKPKS
jgi:hypothetical protein